MLTFIFIGALVAGILMFLLCQNKMQRIGEMLLFSSILALLIAIAPTAVSRLLHG